ncbi:hypothetical protein [Aminobacter sp. MDW-2]|uniref:hypothetical protein n=1 Tax=Aminobacter sp. MDW-2 TaxID=2666139 RepID=UPI0012B095DE|nr:hypothetical protein [Aminobacter sp. MDW-2]MRX32793.1 hypothetical protein [Aminobacter sp. MDW-2]QNH34545.1 hypothetical protein H5P29_00910 [Aminobacter sp. MDW-2]
MVKPVQELFDYLGIKAPLVIAGLLGGVLRALSRRRYEPREIIASPICGALAAGYLAMPTAHYLRAIGWPLPEASDVTNGAIAFLIGTCAMWVADIVLETLVRKFKGPGQA